ncbi:MAG: aspartate--tRNA ligase [Acidobacteria bacterium RIFCSPLOWO2_12_FULL_68_19]|nr:MAG: aspartate--tRNA ligase [Acidobacteria bacterium RIFCSPLOWO2_12_FULL_68_19]
MAEPLGTLTRTHSCGALRLEDVGADVVLLGWVHRVRDLGGLLFVDIRDRAGLTQVVFDKDDEALMAKAKRLRSEFVIGVEGRVRRRSPDTVNPKLVTGDVEVVVRRLALLNEARTPPFPVADDTPVSEDVRLKYRYLDLRRPRLQANIGLRHRVTTAIRQFFDANGFWEIETPILTKSTPEGARDYLVPSRVHPGEFYALPQSPQLFKQILMIGGVERYVQICRCFRDEDLRADRQPEFTQVDVEMSFARPETIFGVIEPLMLEVFRVIDKEIAIPFPRMGYAEAIATYGSDKPDLRCGMPIQDLRDLFRESPFRVFKEIVAGGGTVRGVLVKEASAYSRSEVDGIVELAKQLGAAGLVWARRTADGAITSSIMKALGEEGVRGLLDGAGAAQGDLLLVAAGEPDATSRLLGQLRLNLARQKGLLDPNEYAFTWVVDFPLLEWNPEERRYVSMHHPFTAPHDEDHDRLEAEPGRVRAKAYDLVLNGSEIGGGSIRIHDATLQRRIFSLLNISPEEAKLRFGFFLEALEYGTPPHGGIALGLDRLCAILAGEGSIREVIAFPKTANAVDLMSAAPSPVDRRQLRELHITTRQ